MTKAKMDMAAIRAFASECIAGEPTRVPSRRERELGHIVLDLLEMIEKPEIKGGKPARGATS